MRALAAVGLCAVGFALVAMLVAFRQRAAEEAAMRNLGELRLEVERFQREFEAERDALGRLSDDPRVAPPDAELSAFASIATPCAVDTSL